jgi:putative ABC transport system permease protein
MDTDNLIFVQSFGYAPGYNHENTIREDLDVLRTMPGVIAASPINGIPLSGGGSATTYSISAEDKSPDETGNYYEVDEQGLDALGVKLVAGRAFTSEIIKYATGPSSEMVPEVIMTRAMAKKLFDTDDVVGKRVYDNLGQSATIVGVIDQMLGAWVDWDKLPQVVFHPVVAEGPLARYVVRTRPGQRAAVMKEIETKLGESNRTRVISWVREHDYYITRSYKADTRMAVLLGSLIALLVSMTALGIVGLASFTVNARVKQIGTRRAVGARRIDILRYFMVENWLLTTVGVVLGAILSFAFSYWLSNAFELPKLSPTYVAIGILGMWLVGQLAVLVPAQRAASVPPAVATRTV